MHELKNIPVQSILIFSLDFLMILHGKLFSKYVFTLFERLRKKNDLKQNDLNRSIDWSIMFWLLVQLKRCVPFERQQQKEKWGSVNSETVNVVASMFNAA